MKRELAGPYALALAAAAAAAALAFAMPALVDPEVLLLAAVLASASVGGLGPGLVAASATSVALLYFFTPPVFSLQLQPGDVPRLAIFALLAGSIAAVTAAGRSALRSLQQARRELEDRVRERTAQLEELAGRLIRAQEEERKRIGRELHDHVSQLLGVVAIQIDRLRADERIPPALAGSLDELRQGTTRITDDVHDLSHRLHSSTLDYLGLVPALHKLVDEFSQRFGLPVEFAHDAVPSPLPPDVALALFRVAEESLANIAKHSRARTARVDLRGSGDGIALRIEDDGDGFEPARGGGRAGLGLVSMQERLRAVHGAFRIESAPSRGTRIEASVPHWEFSE